MMGETGRVESRKFSFAGGGVKSWCSGVAASKSLGQCFRRELPLCPPGGGRSAPARSAVGQSDFTEPCELRFRRVQAR